MALRIDIFCRVIDNLGDIGVSWRLARQLTHEHSCSIRLWVDHLPSLARIEPCLDISQPSQDCAGIQVLHWHDSNPPLPSLEQMPDMVIAAFSCDLPDTYIERLREHPKTVWYQLDYLSAQTWVDDFHLQSSPRTDGLTPVFFFPGFTPRTGGLIREKQLTEQLLTHDNRSARRDIDWLQSLGIATEDIYHRRLISVFTYQHAPIETLVHHLEAQQQSSLLLLPDGVKSRLRELHPEHFQFIKWQSIPFLRQPDYDRLLAAMDLNLIRGEDSFVRAIWAGQPFIWHIYPQEAREHHRKLQAWLDIAALPHPVAQLMHEWSEGNVSQASAQVLRGDQWKQWQQSSLVHRQMLLDQTDLASRLLGHWRQHRANIHP